MLVGGIITVVICIYGKTCNQFFTAKDTEKYVCRNINFCEGRKKKDDMEERKVCK